jgi:hypothetical protein
LSIKKSASAMIFRRYTRTVVAVLGLFVVFITFGFAPSSLVQNLIRVEMNKVWLAANVQAVTVSNHLHDGIPDEWTFHTWGDSRAIIALDPRDEANGDFAVRVERTSETGNLALVQEMPVTSGILLICRVDAKGVGGAIQLLARVPGQDWANISWQDVTQNEMWQHYYLEVQVPTDSDIVLIRLRSEGLTWFDDAYCSQEENGGLSANLLQNGDFGQDGMVEDPFAWWERSVSIAKVQELPPHDLLQQRSYLNMIDMLNGDFDSIQLRASQLGSRCVDASDMTGWLLGRYREFEQAGGDVALERLYELAIALAPNCPEPYEALARLYRANRAYLPAAKYFHLASEHAGENVLAGKYAFEEGFLHIRYTGDLPSAILALTKAESQTGWESAPWYWGASSRFLGEALEAQGDFVAATAAYQRVLDCNRCVTHHQVARSRLDVLKAN